MAKVTGAGSLRRLSQPSRDSSLAMLLFLVFALFAFGTAASNSAAEKGPASSSSPESDLICHTTNPAECYPRIFQPTDEFQTVHDDQELPSGLHIRMNVWTGQKEAKINVPDELDPSLEGLPVDRAIVVVEPESTGDEPQIPSGAPSYDPVGKVKEPKEESKTESRVFRDSLAVLKTLALDDRPFDAALETLEDIAHDIYYGLKIAEDTSAVKALLCMMSSQEVFAQGANEISVAKASQAASILGAALQNNPTALREVEAAWNEIKGSACEGAARPLNGAVFNMFFPEDSTSMVADNGHSGLVKAKIGAINGLIKSPAIRDDFLANDGMAQVLRVLISDAPEMVAAQRKLTNMVLDNFLDENMGATLGVWPRRLPNDEAWDRHIKQIAETHRRDKSHWSVELWNALKDQRAADKKRPYEAKEEL